MAEESDSLKEEMSALLRGDLERAREKRNGTELRTAPEPKPQPEPERRSGFLRRFSRP